MCATRTQPPAISRRSCPPAGAEASGWSSCAGDTAATRSRTVCADCSSRRRDGRWRSLAAGQSEPWRRRISRRRRRRLRTPGANPRRLQVRRGVLEVDFSASSATGTEQPERALGEHARRGVLRGALLHRPQVPQNDGLTRSVRVICPEGSILWPRFPAAVSARHLTVQRASEVLCRALSELLPDRAVASSHVSFPAFVFQAIDPRSGRLTLFADILGGGGGARPSCRVTSDRLLHVQLRVAAGRDRRAGVPVSDRAHRTGARLGRPRPAAGGLGLRRDYRVLADTAEGMYYIEQLDRRFGAAGAAGGGAGAPAPVRLRPAGGSWRSLRRGKGYLHLGRGDTLSFVGAGGGGDGRPRPSRGK